MSRKSSKEDEKDTSRKSSKSSDQSYLANQGSPNTHANAWPVKISDGDSNVVGSLDNPLPVSIQNQVITCSSSQVQPIEGNPENEINPGNSVFVRFDTSNFREAYVWVQLLSAGRVDVEIISFISPIPDIAISMNITEASFNLTNSNSTVKIVNASGTSIGLLLSNPVSAKDPINVLVAVKGIG